MKTIKQLINFAREKTVLIVKAYGLGFLITVILSDLLDEVVIPGLLLYFGHPALSITALAGDIDWITYPLYFTAAGVFRNSLAKRGIAEQVQRNLQDCKSEGWPNSFGHNLFEKQRGALILN